MDIKVEIQDTEVRAALRRLVAAGTDLSPAMRSIANYLQAVTEKAFATETDPATGDPWDDLSDATLARRAKSGHINRDSGAARKLQVTRNLLDSINPDYDSATAVVGTNLAYAATHQFGAGRGEFGATKHGAPIPWGDIPARPFLGTSPSDLDHITGILADHIRKSFA